jgi:lipid-A-disaccharide synthase-like uncharacterized protein
MIIGFLHDAETASWLERLFDNPWIALGLLGQALFAVRFLIQWIASERAKRVVIPMSFWIVSILASTLVLAYGVLKADLVIILGQLTGFVVYGRNIALHRAQNGDGLARIG